MSTAQASPTPNSPVARMFMSLPILGLMARDLGRDVNIAFYYLVIIATLMVFAVQFWGLAALVLAALAMVPVIFTLIIWITLP